MTRSSSRAYFVRPSLNAFAMQICYEVASAASARRWAWVRGSSRSGRAAEGPCPYVSDTPDSGIMPVVEASV